MKDYLKQIRRYDVFFIVCILVFTAVVFRYNGYINDIVEDYNSKIENVTRDYNEKLEILNNKLTETDTDLNLQIDLLENLLEAAQKENQDKIKGLSESISKVEEQSNIQLDELKQEVKNINIQSADFSAIVDDVLDSVVSIATNKGQGSGAIIREEGLIVTNNHVIEDVSQIRVLTYKGDIYSATVVGADTSRDIAVLEIQGNFQALDFGNSDDIKVGEKVIALGNPGGLDFSVTEGIVSALREAKGITYIQTDVPINPGNSGGPLVNKKGEIIGINNFKIRDFESLGFAIASNIVKDTVDQIIA